MPSLPTPQPASPAAPPPTPGPLPRLEPRSPPPRETGSRLLHYTLHSRTPALDRPVCIHLPAAYLEQPDRRFPVLYLHDGQNLFDPSTSFLPGHTWRADTTTDDLTGRGLIEPLILVGINNAGLRRMTEYTPTVDLRLGGGEGDRYGSLLLDELKPLVDEQLRTLPGPEHTGMGGSSLGGLISLYLALRHRDRIGKIAVMSPSLWWDRGSILGMVRQALPDPELRIWLDMGTAEGARHLRDADQLFALLIERGWQNGCDLLYQRAQDAVHNEDAWAARLPDVLSFLFPADPTPCQPPPHSTEPCPPPF